MTVIVNRGPASNPYQRAAADERRIGILFPGSCPGSRLSAGRQPRWGAGWGPSASKETVSACGYAEPRT